MLLHRSATLMTIALALSGLAGCATVDLPSLPDAVPAAWRDRPVLHAGAAAADLALWWTGLKDPVLDDLVSQALRENLTLAQAHSRLRQATAVASGGDALYRPALSLSSRTLQDVSATDTYLHVGLDMVWEIGAFGAREAHQRAARADLDSADTDARLARVNTVAGVVRTYAELRTASRQAALFGDLAAVDGRSRDLLAVLETQRLGTHGAVLEAAAQLARTEAGQAPPEQQRDRSAQGLALLLGRTEPDPSWLQGAPAPVVPPFSLTRLPADLLRQRPEIRHAEAGVLRAAGELGIARADLYPKLSLGASLLYAYNITKSIGTRTDHLPAIGPTIDIPLFDWGQRRAAASAREEALQGSLLAYRQTVLEGVAETEQSLAALQATTARRDRLADALDLLRSREQTARARRQAGLSSELAVLGAHRDALLAELDLSAAELDRTLSFVALFRSLGGAALPAEATP